MTTINEQLTVPDFDTYPITHTLRTASLIDGGVAVTWDDGSESRLPNVWLREFSPDSSTFHPVTRERSIAVTDLPDDLTAAAAIVSDDGFLCVRWMPEGLESRYHPGWLYAHRPDGERSLFRLPERQLWHDRGNLKPIWFDGNEVRRGRGETFRNWVEAMHVSGVGLLNRLPADPAIIPEIPELIGPIRPSNFGDVFDVRNVPDANTNANTALALAVHSDLATREYMPGLQFLFCLVNDATGGDSILADGFSIAAQLKDESNEFYEVLSTVAIPYGTKDKEYDHRFTVPLLEHDSGERLTSVRYTYWLRAPMRGDFDTITTFYAALRRFQQIANDPTKHMTFRLNPGEMMAFDNRRVLHGRAAFDPASGQRLLRGCYGEREEVESRLRILYRQERLNANA